MKILVTGCNGQLGRAINEVYKGENVSLINTDFGTELSLDITDAEAVDKMFSEQKPDAVINCAAYTAVDNCESEEDKAYTINALGPKNLAVAAKKYNAKLVHISTDYVFKGDATKPYVESDKPDPISAYGRTKLAGENFVKENCDKYFIIRTAWLYGDGKNFVKTMMRLSEDHAEVNVVSDQLGSPTSAMELARAIKYIVNTEKYGIYHGTCEGVCSWADFTSEIFRLANKSTKVNYILTKDYPTAAARPAYSVLENENFNKNTDFRFADWKDAIAEYMKGFKA